MVARDHPQRGNPALPGPATVDTILLHIDVCPNLYAHPPHDTDTHRRDGDAPPFATHILELYEWARSRHRPERIEFVARP